MSSDLNVKFFCFMKKSNIIITSAVALVVVALTFSFFISGQETNKEDSETISVGASLPLSGSLSLFGIGERKGLELAAEKWNAGGNSFNLDLFFEDSKGQASIGVSAARKLLSSNDCDFIFTSLTPVSQAVSPVVIESGARQVIIAMDETLARESNRVYRIYPGIRGEGKKMTEILKASGARRPAIYSFQHPAFDASLNDVLIPYLNSHFPESHLVSQYTEFESSEIAAGAAKLVGWEPDIIIINGFYSHLPSIVRSIKEAGLNDSVPLLGGLNLSICLSNGELAGYSDQQFLYAMPLYIYKQLSGELLTPQQKYFEDRFVEVYGEAATYESAFAYDALLFIANILEDGGIDRFEETASNFDFIGAVGKLEFDEYGSVITEWESVSSKAGTVSIIE